LWFALRLIISVDIGFDDTSGRAGVIRCGLPGTVHQFDLPQFLQNDTAPVLR
jgi:hypothetical protein